MEAHNIFFFGYITIKDFDYDKLIASARTRKLIIE